MSDIQKDSDSNENNDWSLSQESSFVDYNKDVLNKNKSNVAKQKIGYKENSNVSYSSNDKKV